MKWSLLELNKYKGDTIEFNQSIDMEQALKERDKEILAVAPVQVKGIVSVEDNAYVVHLTIDTVLTLPSTRSLTPVTYPMFIVVDEVYMTQKQYDALPPEETDDSTMILEKDLLDLCEAVEDHILLAIPFQVLTEEEKNATNLPQGETWKLLSEEAYFGEKMQQKEKQMDPRLAKLSALLDNNEDTDEM